MTIQKYLSTLIEEKGASVDDVIHIDGHFGMSWSMLIDFIENMPEHHAAIRKALVTIDFKSGDIFYYLRHLACGMVDALDY